MAHLLDNLEWPRPGLCSETSAWCAVFLASELISPSPTLLWWVGLFGQEGSLPCYVLAALLTPWCFPCALPLSPHPPGTTIYNHFPPKNCRSQELSPLSPFSLLFLPAFCLSLSAFLPFPSLIINALSMVHAGYFVYVNVSLLASECWASETQGLVTLVFPVLSPAFGMWFYAEQIMVYGVMLQSYSWNPFL